jgi:hypothetical protein
LDLLKIAIFLAAFLLLIYLGRLLSAHAESRPYAGPGPFQPEAVSTTTLATHDVAKKSAVTGAEFGFPVPIPPVTRDQKGKFNRPYFLNYHFSKTDLKTGPPDAAAFYDDFFLQAQDPESQYVWNYKYLVATPSGLQKLMSDERYASLYFDDPVIVVSRWDLRLILSTVVEEILKSYGKADFEEENQKAPESP